MQSCTTLSLLEVLAVFLATCFGSYTEPSQGLSSKWFVCTIVGALKVTRSRITNSSWNIRGSYIYIYIYKYSFIYIPTIKIKFGSDTLHIEYWT